MPDVRIADDRMPDVRIADDRMADARMQDDRLYLIKSIVPNFILLVDASNRGREAKLSLNIF